MPYPEFMIRPKREDLTRLGFEETKTPEQVDEVIKNSKGTVMMVVNSVCGCAAGKARPGIALALEHDVKPDRVATVFAGADIEATERARSYFTGYQPSSPDAVFTTYRLRFGIETSYRQMHQARIRTSTRDPLLRLLYVGVALILRNVWVWARREALAGHVRGDRKGAGDRLPFRQMLSWLEHLAEETLWLYHMASAKHRPRA